MGEWIPVTERLPEDREGVLITIIGYYKPVIAEYYSCGKFWSGIYTDYSE